MLYKSSVMGKLLTWFGIIVASWMLVWLIVKLLFWIWGIAQNALVVGIIAVGAYFVWNFLADRKLKED